MGQPRQWTCYAPEGVQVTKELRTELAKAEDRGIRGDGQCMDSASALRDERR